MKSCSIVEWSVLEFSGGVELKGKCEFAYKPFSFSTLSYLLFLIVDIHHTTPHHTPQPTAIPRQFIYTNLTPHGPFSFLFLPQTPIYRHFLTRDALGQLGRR